MLLEYYHSNMNMAYVNIVFTFSIWKEFMNFLLKIFALMCASTD